MPSLRPLCLCCALSRPEDDLRKAHPSPTA